MNLTSVETLLNNQNKGGTMKTMKDFEEGLIRYKKYYPQNCEGKTDIEILLFRNLVTEKQAEEMLKIPELPTSNAAATTMKDMPKKKRVYPYTEKQVQKLCQDAVKDWTGGNPNVNIEDVAFDLADSMLYNNERLQAYFIKIGMPKKNWVGALADYIVS